MSEYCNSYHIRTDDAVGLEKRMRASKLAGIVYGPASGWLTFVPYENLAKLRQVTTLEQFAPWLSSELRATVLHYCHAADHGWTFALARPDGTVSRFASWWDPEPTIERDHLDLAALAPFAPVNAFEPLLQCIDIQAALEKEPSYRFAELLGLPAYKWLSPGLAQRDTDSLIAKGGRKLGSKPPSTAERLRLPPNRNIRVPRPDLSAREALSVAQRLMKPFNGCSFAGLACEGLLRDDGRLRPDVRGCAWRATYRQREGADLTHVWVSSAGNVRFNAASAPGMLADLWVLLDDDWLDSTDIVPLVASEPTPAGQSDQYFLTASLGHRPDLPLCWDVRRRYRESPPMTMPYPAGPSTPGAGKFVSRVLSTSAWGKFSSSGSANADRTASGKPGESRACAAAHLNGAVPNRIASKL
jgi:hypothetical protein